VVFLWSSAKTVFIRHAENALSPIFLPGAHIRLCEKKSSSGPLLLLKQAIIARLVQEVSLHITLNFKRYSLVQ